MNILSKTKSGICSWPDRMVLYSILATIKSLLESASPEDSFYGHKAEDSLRVISQAINFFFKPEENNYPKDIEYQFAPTGALQELSISNGWDKIYLKLSEEFDRTIYCLKEKS